MTDQQVAAILGVSLDVVDDLGDMLGVVDGRWAIADVEAAAERLDGSAGDDPEDDDPEDDHLEDDHLEDDDPEDDDLEDDHLEDDDPEDDSA